MSAEIEFRPIEPTMDNAHRVTELFEMAFAGKVDEHGKRLYPPEVVAQIADPNNEANVEENLRRMRLWKPGDHSYVYMGAHVDGKPHAVLKVTPWKKVHQEPYSRDVDDPREYDSPEQRVLGAHVLAVGTDKIAVEALGLSLMIGRRLFTEVAKHNPGSIIKSEVDNRDKNLKQYMRSWHMTDTGLLARSEVGDLPENEWPEHRLFDGYIIDDGRVVARQ